MTQQNLVINEANAITPARLDIIVSIANLPEHAHLPLVTLIRVLVESNWSREAAILRLTAEAMETN